jgi:tRNA threonylcarbamoyladenosine biosynthesis protein TsaB
VNLLGIDTSTPASAACALRADGEAFEVEPAPERLLERPGHAAELMPAVVRCLEGAGLGWGDLDAVGVGVGPGTFTGLRVGVATARGLAAARGLELRPVSSLAALATGAGGEPGANGSGLGRAVLALIDARRGEVFAGLYEGEEVVWEPFAAAPEEVAERVRTADVAPLGVGDGAVRFRDVLAAAGVEVPAGDSRAHVVRGLSICRLAATAAPVPAEGVLPDYLRLPDAKPRTA